MLINALQGTKGKYRACFSQCEKKCRNGRETVIIGERPVNLVTSAEQSVELLAWEGEDGTEEEQILLMLEI